MQKIVFSTFTDSEGSDQTANVQSAQAFTVHTELEKVGSGPCMPLASAITSSSSLSPATLTLHFRLHL